MARSRNIKPGFFQNEDLAECCAWARLLFIGLWTLADRQGRLEDRPKRIKGAVFPFDPVDVEPLLSELDRFRFIVRYEVAGLRLIQVRNFLKHQTPHYTERASALPAPVDPVANSPVDPAQGSVDPAPTKQSGRMTPGVPPKDSRSAAPKNTRPARLLESDGDQARRLQECSAQNDAMKRGSLPPDSLIHRFTDSRSVTNQPLVAQAAGVRPDLKEVGIEADELMRLLGRPSDARIVWKVGWLVVAGVIPRHLAIKAAAGPRAVSTSVQSPVAYFRKSLREDIGRAAFEAAIKSVTDDPPPAATGLPTNFASQLIAALPSAPDPITEDT